MTPRSCLVLALAIATSSDAVCTGLDTCTDGESFDESPAVSLLQSEMHVSKGVQGIKVLAAPRVSAGVKKGPLATADAVVWSGVALGLLLVAGVLSFIIKGSFKAHLPKYVAEFIGTYMLVWSVGCNVLVGDKTWGVVSIACTLMVSIYAFGAVSGANFNPAVSVSLGLTKKMPWIDVTIYVCVQLAAGILAALSYGWILGQTADLAVVDGYKWWQAGLAELLYTFMLTFVVLNVAASKRHGGKDQFYGLAIGFTVVAGGYGAGSISGGCFNPAIALAIDSSSSASGFGLCFVYIASQIVGCAIAAGLFRVCRPEDFIEGSDDSYETTTQSTLTSEFLGTYMLVLTVGLNVITASKAGVFSIASSLMCMIFALGSVSGAHFNPAVTVAIAFSGRNLIPNSKAVRYVWIQLFGGVAGAFTYALLLNGKTLPLAPKHSSNVLDRQALIGELMFTFLLCFVVLSVATTKNALSQYFGLAIGACVIAGGYAIGSLSGGSLNPAVSAGLALSDCILNNGPIVHFFSYAGVETMGGLLAATVFKMTHEAEFSTSK